MIKQLFIFMALPLYLYASCPYPELPSLPDGETVLSKNYAPRIYDFDSNWWSENAGTLLLSVHRFEVQGTGESLGTVFGHKVSTGEPKNYTWFDPDGAVIATSSKRITRVFQTDILDCEGNSIGTIAEELGALSHDGFRWTTTIRDGNGQEVRIKGEEWDIQFYDNQRGTQNSVLAEVKTQERWFFEDDKIISIPRPSDDGLEVMDNRLLGMLAILVERNRVEYGLAGWVIPEFWYTKTR